jgi:hypothetical protein
VTVLSNYDPVCRCARKRCRVQSGYSVLGCWASSRIAVPITTDGPEGLWNRLNIYISSVNWHLLAGIIILTLLKYTQPELSLEFCKLS